MPSRRSRSPQDSPWIVPDISEAAVQAAEQAARQTGLPLATWLVETVLRATQEGVEAPGPSPADSRTS